MLAATDYIDLNTAAKKYLPISRRHLATMCESGIFKTAFKPGCGGKTSKWLIARAEILQHRINNHATVQY